MLTSKFWSSNRLLERESQIFKEVFWKGLKKIPENIPFKICTKILCFLQISWQFFSCKKSAEILRGLFLSARYLQKMLFLQESCKMFATILQDICKIRFSGHLGIETIQWISHEVSKIQLRFLRSTMRSKLPYSMNKTCARRPPTVHNCESYVES